jgi:hypothetical protein
MSNLDDRPGTRAADEDAAGGSIAAAIAAATTELAQVVDVPAGTVPVDELAELVDAAGRLRAAAEELQTRLVGQAHAVDLAGRAGYTSTVAWVKHRCRYSGGAAGALVRHARQLTPAVEPVRHAWATGLLNADQTAAIATGINRLHSRIDPTALNAAQQLLIERAPALTVDDLAREANHVVEYLDPDGADDHLRRLLADEDRRALTDTTLRFHSRRHGTTGISGRLPDLHADMLKKVLDAYAAPRRASAGNGANRRGASDDSASTDGDPASIDGMERAAQQPRVSDGHLDGSIEGGEFPITGTTHLTYAQRLGRALTELLEHLDPTTLPHSGGANASIVLTTSLQELQSGISEAALDSGGHLSHAQTRRLACNARLIPAVLGTDSAVLDLGYSTRLFTPYQRIALAARDRGCVFPGCDRPPAWTEAHHLNPWRTGGRTDINNGALLCPHHHRLVHAGTGWELRSAADGIIEVVPPARLDRTRTPRRHDRYPARPP